jgi:hypothetical protein
VFFGMRYWELGLMRKKVAFSTVLICLLLLSCTGAPVSTSTAVPSFTTSGRLLPSATPYSSPTVIPPQTADPQVQEHFAGVDALLPGDSQPLYSQAWFRSAEGEYASAGFLPYSHEGGLSLLIIGKPRENDASFSQEQTRIWDWQDAGMEPKTWQEIRPMDMGPSRGLSSFLGRDEKGQWWAVMTAIDWSVPEVTLLGVFPIVNLDDVQIEPVSFLPVEENQRVTQFLVRTNDRLTLYEVNDHQARDLWSTDRIISGSFHVHSYANPGGSVDVTGDGRQDLLIVWNATLPHLIDAYQMTTDESDRLHWLGRLDSSLQYTDVTGDGIAGLLRPDDPQSPTQWQVTAWNGDTFQEGEILTQLQPISSSPVRLSEIADLPRIPSALVFQNRGNSQDWWHWSPTGGEPEKMNKPPGHSDDTCSPQMYGGYGDACFSPAGRYQLIDMPAGIEGSYTGIVDGVTQNKVRIPGSFVYTEGYYTFGWSPDETFLLFAQGEGVAKLSKVNPTSGEEIEVFNYSLCGVDDLDCSRTGSDAITDPVVFEDGSLGFAIQAFDHALYPPPGIYRLSQDEGLTMLAALPYIDESKGSLADLHPHTLIYGHLLWSPDKSMFLFYDLFVGHKTGVRTLLLGKVDGSALWDLRDVFPDLYEFRWE